MRGRWPGSRVQGSPWKAEAGGAGLNGWVCGPHGVNWQPPTPSVTEEGDTQASPHKPHLFAIPSCLWHTGLPFPIFQLPLIFHIRCSVLVQFTPQLFLCCILVPTYA